MLNTDQSINLDRWFIDMSSAAVFNMVLVVRFLVFCAVVRTLLFVLLSFFSFGHCIVYLSSI